MEKRKLGISRDGENDIFRIDRRAGVTARVLHNITVSVRPLRFALTSRSFCRTSLEGRTERWQGLRPDQRCLTATEP